MMSHISRRMRFRDIDLHSDVQSSCNLHRRQRRFAIATREGTPFASQHRERWLTNGSRHGVGATGWVARIPPFRETGLRGERCQVISTYSGWPPTRNMSDCTRIFWEVEMRMTEATGGVGFQIPTSIAPNASKETQKRKLMWPRK